jgi:hypothetical protein
MTGRSNEPHGHCRQTSQLRGRRALKLVGIIGLCLFGGAMVNICLTMNLEPAGSFENGNYYFGIGLPFSSMVARGQIAGNSCWASIVPGSWRIDWPGAIANSLIQSLMIALPFIIGSQMHRLRRPGLGLSRGGKVGIRCPRCAYDLRGNTSSVCPECGAGVALVLARARWTGTARWPGRLWKL